MAIRLLREALATADLRRPADRLGGRRGGRLGVHGSRSPSTRTPWAGPRLSVSPRGADGPAGLAAPLMGHAADRFPRRDVLLAATLARAVCSAPPRSRRRSTRRSRCCSRSRRCSPSSPPPTSPPRPRCCRSSRPTRAAGGRQRALERDRQRRASSSAPLAGGLLVAASARPPRSAAAAAGVRVAAALLARIHRDELGDRDACRGRSRSPAGGGAARRRGVEGGHAGGATCPEAARPLGDGLLGGARVIARDRRLRCWWRVESSTLLEGMIDVLVVVTALRVMDLGTRAWDG